MELVGGGAVLGGLILGAIGAFIIDRRFRWAGIYALAGAVFSYFGFIHGEKLEWGASPTVALGYVIMAGLFLFLHTRQVTAGETITWEPLSNEETAEG